MPGLAILKSAKILKEKCQMKNRYWLFALIAIVLWALSSVLVRITFGIISSVHLAALRNLISMLTLLIVCLAKGIPPPKKRDIPIFIIAGLLGFAVFSICFNYGITLVTAATGNVIFAITPIISAVIAQVVLKERIRFLGWVFTGVSFAGILVIVLWNGILAINHGAFWILGAALCNSIYNLIQRRLLKTYPAIRSTAYVMVVGAFLMTPLLPGAFRELLIAPPSAIVYVFYMGILSSAVSYLLWARALALAKRTADVTNFLYLSPFVAAIMAFAIFSELPDWGTVVGGAIIMFGLWMFQKTA